MFLRRVYNQWKAFFWLITLALTAQFFFMAKGIENVPFFLYHMYSYAHQQGDSFNVILIKTPKGYLNPYQLSGRESEMLMNNITYYNLMKYNAWRDNNSPTVHKRFSRLVPAGTYDYLQKSLLNDSINFSGYTKWWQRYFKALYNNSFDSVSVVSGYIRYQPRFIKPPVDSVIFTCYFK